MIKQTLLVGAVIGVAFVPIAVPLFAQDTEKKKSTYEYLDLFGDIFERVRADYVVEVDDGKLIEAAIDGMLRSLDPHSGYLAPKAAENMRVQTSGEFGGLGIEVSQEKGFVKVVAPIDDTPAAKAGIKAGDYITHVDDEPTLGLSLDEAIERMRGPIGSETLLTIQRPEKEEPLKVTIVRDKIKIRAVRSRLEGDVVVLRISSFTGQTFGNLVSEIEKQTAAAGGIDAVNGFVIDLRNNPGGLLDQAVKVSDAFLEGGEIVSTRGRNERDNERFNATPGDLTQGKPIVVLVNRGSASASEIVSGALQDHQRAIIVGTQTFGKGSVQRITPVSSNGAIRITTSRYYTPSGRSIQTLGVAPDIVVEQRPRVETPDDTEVQNTRGEANLRGSLENDSLSEDELETLEADRKAREKTAKLRNEDYQLAYAIDILTGLSVLQE